MSFTDKEKIDSLAESAVKSIRDFQEKGYIPILLAFAAPKDFQHAHVIVPGGLDARQVIQDLLSAKAYRTH